MKRLGNLYKKKKLQSFHTWLCQDEYGKYGDNNVSYGDLSNYNLFTCSLLRGPLDLYSKENPSDSGQQRLGGHRGLIDHPVQLKDYGLSVITEDTGEYSYGIN